MICPECVGRGFDYEGNECVKCEGIGELPDILPEPPVPKPEPPEFELDADELNRADWWKQGDDGSDENPPPD